jgi:hypothetical protein
MSGKRIDIRTDVSTGTSPLGAPLNLYGCHRGYNQKWYMQEP